MVRVYAPLTDFLQPEKAEELTDQGLFGDDVDTLRVAWTSVNGLWADALAAARRLPSDMLDVNVEDEWSFIQTLRHLVFVVDSWLLEVVLEESAPHHRLGMPPDFIANRATELGLEVDARPSLDEVLRAWESRRLRVDDYLASVTPGELARTCAAYGGKFQVIGALQTIVSETWSHYHFATRDLRTLTDGA